MRRPTATKAQTRLVRMQRNICTERTAKVPVGAPPSVSLRRGSMPYLARVEVRGRARRRDAGRVGGWGFGLGSA